MLSYCREVGKENMLCSICVVFPSFFLFFFRPLHTFPVLVLNHGIHLRIFSIQSEGSGNVRSQAFYASFAASLRLFLMSLSILMAFGVLNDLALRNLTSDFPFISCCVATLADVPQARTLCQLNTHIHVHTKA
jgi:hypothetical protein